MFTDARPTQAPRRSTIILVYAMLQLAAPISHAEVTTIGDCRLIYEQCLQKWKERRIEFLRSEAGYLNLAGLYWLSAGQNSFGSAETNDIVFPATAAATIGYFDLNGQVVMMHVADNVDVRFNDRRVRSMPLPDDTSPLPAVVRHGQFSWTIIKRAGRFAVRLRDFQHPLLNDFSSIDYYPTNSNMRIAADWLAYDEPRIIDIGTVIAGLSYKPTSSGIVRFESAGQIFELEAYDASGELFFVFGDQTSGRETYPAGRFLYARAADSDGKVLLDFNTAQNPPCAFNEFATCPVASPRNRLATRIEAGERYDSTAH